jgi:L-lactate dehydrogenase complex protein LldF
MHKSKEDVAELFHRKFGTPPHSSPADIAAFVRDFLREKFIHADVGVTGANFLVADTGAIGLTENEGNGLMTVSFPRIHIVLAGIERVIPSIRHIPFFWQWLGVHGTGQNISAYNTLLTGPRQPGEMDGPEKMVVILLDNGRSEVYNDPDARAALKCIRCGACLNACPVYRHIGGYTYGSTYTGPIGSVLTPFLSGFKEYGHLSEASTLCGRCSDVCPVKIPLHDLLLLNRQRNVAQHGSGLLWRAGMKAFVFTFGNRERVDFFNGKFKRRLARIVGNPLGKGKKIPRFADHSFSRNWKLQNL